MLLICRVIHLSSRLKNEARILDAAASAFPRGGPWRYGRRVSHKSARIEELIAGCQGQSRDAHYLGYFACFNRQWFYEAHDVLEELWLGCRKGASGDFYKGLIQLAGAFVHMQKGRPQPAAKLLALSTGYLGRYGDHYEGLDVSRILELERAWGERMAQFQSGQFPLEAHPPPQLALDEDPEARG